MSRKRASLFESDGPSKDEFSGIDVSEFKPIRAPMIEPKEVGKIALDHGFTTRHTKTEMPVSHKRKLSRQFNIRVTEETAEKFFSLQRSLGLRQAGLLLEKLVSEYSQE